MSTGGAARRLSRRLAVRLPAEGDFRSRLHDDRAAAVLGVSLGVTFGICFLTGLVSHAHQNPPSWLTIPPRPAGLYRVTQGLHVVTGTASIPLLLVKLWVVYPKLFTRPVVGSAARAVERVSLVPLVGGGLMLLFTGLVNVARWYSPMPFFFPVAHFWAAWITMGALVIHVAAKAATTRATLFTREPAAPSPPGEGLSRRGLLGTTFATAALLAVTTVGQTLRPLRRLAVLAPRDLRVGSQGLPVNRAAVEAGVIGLATDPGYALVVEGRVATPLRLTLADLAARPLHGAELPIACVEGWSASAAWRGIPVRDLLAEAGAPEGAEVVVESLEPAGFYRTSVLNHRQAADRDTLLAVEVNGERLNLDHGFPLRLVAPNRPGVLQTKWVHRLEVR